MTPEQPAPPLAARAVAAICYFIQEMVSRLGIATGKSHAAMIYERFGKWWGRFSLFDLLAVNFLTLIIEFAAISLALSALGILTSPYPYRPSVDVDGRHGKLPSLADCHCALLDGPDVVRSGLHGASELATVAHNSVVPTMPAGGITSRLVFPGIAIVGTTIAPWQFFFQQSCVAEKRLRFSALKWARLDTLVGAIFTVCVAGAMMLVGNYGYEHKIAFHDPAQLSLALGPIAGNSSN